MYKNIIFGILGFAAFYILVSYLKNKRLISGILLTAVQGLAALFAVNLIGSFFGIHLNINPFSLCVSGVFGTAGVIMMLLINAIV